MKINVVLPLLFVFGASTAMADFRLSQNRKAVKCTAEDNQSLVLNAKRTNVKYTVEGETQGAQKIEKIETDGKKTISYKTPELTMTLSDDGDSFQFEGDSDPQSMDCK